MRRLIQRYRYSLILLKQLVKTDFKLRYQGSVLGYAWSLLRPLLIFLILYIVFAKFLRFGDAIPNFPIYLLLGIVIWTFFADMTSQSVASIVARGDVIRKIKIPRWIIPVSTSISALINLGLNLIIVGVFIFVSKTDLLITGLWLPLILLEVYVLSLGISLLLSALFVRYRDVSYIWEVIIQAGFYATPIIYPLSLITSLDFQRLLLLNPMAQAIQDARYAVVTHETTTINNVFSSDYVRIFPIAFSFLFLLLGLWYFKRDAKNFAENI
jgi:ABC-2 type transport system permease protein